MIFTELFYKHIMFRKSCSRCHFCNTTRPSDITIADFWGWEKTNSEFNKDDKGVSLILLNTEKGRKLFDNIKNDMNVFPARLEDCLQTHLKRSSEEHPDSQRFECDYKKNGFEYVIKKYGKENVTLKVRIKKIAHRIKIKLKSYMTV